jgi:hypothetical protein
MNSGWALGGNMGIPPGMAYGFTVGDSVAVGAWVAGGVGGVTVGVGA